MHEYSASKKKEEHLAQQVAAVSGVDPFSLGDATVAELAELAETMLRTQMGMFHPDRGRGPEDRRLFQDAAEAKGVADELGFQDCILALQQFEAANVGFRREAEADTAFSESLARRTARRMLHSARAVSRSRDLGVSFAGYDIEFENLLPRAYEAARIVVGDLDPERYRYWIPTDRAQLAEVLTIFKVALAEPRQWRAFCERDEIQKLAEAAIAGPYSAEIKSALSDIGNLDAAAWFRKHHARNQKKWGNGLEDFDAKVDQALSAVGPVIIHEEGRHAVYARSIALAFCRPETIGEQVRATVSEIRYAAGERDRPSTPAARESEGRILAVEYGLACGDAALIAAARSELGVALERHHLEIREIDILPWQFTSRNLKGMLSRDELRAGKRVDAAFHEGEEKFVKTAKQEDRRREILSVVASGSDEVMRAMLNSSIADRISRLSDESGAWISEARDGTRTRIYPLGIFNTLENDSPGFGAHFRVNNPGATVLGIDMTRGPTRRLPQNPRAPDSFSGWPIAPTCYIDIDKPLDRSAAAVVLPRLKSPPSLEFDDTGTLLLLVGVVETDTMRDIRILGRVLRIEKRPPTPAGGASESRGNDAT